MKSKILSILLFFSFFIQLLLLIPSVNAVNEDIYFSDNFQNDTIGELPFEGTWLIGYESAGNFDVQTGGGIKYVRCGGIGGVNSQGGFITSNVTVGNIYTKTIQIYHSLNQDVGTYNYYIRLIDENLDTVINLQMEFSSGGSFYRVNPYNFSSSNYQTIDDIFSALSPSTNRLFTFTYCESNSSINLKINKSGTATILRSYWFNHNNKFIYNSANKYIKIDRSQFLITQDVNLHLSIILYGIIVHYISPSSTKTIFLNIRDLDDNTLFGLRSVNWYDNQTWNANYTYAYFKSNLWENSYVGAYDSYTAGDIPIYANFTNGDTGYFYLSDSLTSETNIQCWKNNDLVDYSYKVFSIENMQNGSVYTVYIQQVTSETNKSKIYINLYDSITGNKLVIRGKYSTGETVNEVKCNVYSDLFDGDYSPTSNSISYISTYFNNGEYHTISFENCIGIVNNIITYFYNLSDLSIQTYDGITYTWYLTPINWNEGYNNKICNDMKYPTCVETDKNVYQYGETVRGRYKLPTVMQLSEMDIYTGQYYLCFMCDLDSQIIFPGLGDTPYTPISCVNDGQWHIFTFNPGEPDDNLDNYQIMIFDEGWWILRQYLIHDNPLKFVVYKGELFVPSGNITSISPTEPKLNQLTKIYFNTNNDFKLDVVYALTEKTEATTTGIKPLGTANYTIYPQLLGYYSVNLYVFNGLNYSSLVDTASFLVNSTNGSLGSFGKGEFLYIPYRRVIAGFDTVQIMYHSLRENASLEIKDSTGAIYTGSTIVNTNPNILNIKLPPYAEIGLWNVTLYGNKTMYASFNVIAEEGNWIEFSKHIYLENEPFTLLIMHNKKIVLEFSKDGTLQGSNYILQVNELPIGNIEIPLTIIIPTSGNWQVEMWEINNNIRIKLLAQDTCIVTYKQYTPSVGNFDFIALITSQPDIFKIIFGLILVIGLTFSPLVLVSKTRLNIDIPPLVYIALFLLGVSLSALIGFFPIFTLFFVLFGIIIALAILWVQRKIA